MCRCCKSAYFVYELASLDERRILRTEYAYRRQNFIVVDDGKFLVLGKLF